MRPVYRSFLSLLPLSAFLAACAGSASSPAALPAAEASPAACTRQLAPRAVQRPAARVSAPVTVAPSRLIVEARLPLARLASELERSVAPRIAEASGVGVGPVGVVHYSVDRGAFSLSIADGRLLVETPLHGRAEACSGRRCYANCEPRALARAAIPLWLRPDYRFDRSQVSLEFTRGCKVRALGGLLSVDVTPMLKARVAPQLERVRREIDRRLPDVRADVERAWSQLSAPRMLPLGGCVVVDPIGLVQGPTQEVGGMAHARFALLARPELRTDCSGAAAPSVPLPPLRSDAALPEEDSVTFGMELPLRELARAFEAATLGAGAAPRYHITEAEVTAHGRRVAAELELAGELCGSVLLQAQPSFAGEEGVIELTDGELDAAESARLRAAGVDPAALAPQLSGLARPATPLSLPLLRLAPTALAALFSDPEFSLSARISEMRAAGAAARGESLVAWVEARGNLLLAQR